jgi:ribosomal protein S13
MPSVPLSMHQLEAIAEAVARDLLEEWAINDRFTIEQLEEAKQNAVNDAIFVINNFMEHFNTYMLTEAENKKII